ncbi:MAG: ATP-dependent RecD-like DNA helicase, partial [Polyangiaceae bacterium]|nr:ATP-dependent RecD-like DNA helicase [Polyangiaceae bacterium]
FRVVRLEVLGARHTVVGKMQRLAAGSRVRVSGQLERDPRHGPQLRAHTVLVLDPDTRDGIQRYLGSGLIPGIGPGLAKRIVDRFGDATLEVLDRDPTRMGEVPGLGARRVQALARAWQEQRALRDVMVFLQGHGVSAALATRVFRRYGCDAIRIVSANPYRLALDIWGIGFRKADEIARNVGIASDAPERISAATIHVLQQAGERGHVFLPRATLAAEAEQVAQVGPASVEAAVQSLCASEHARCENLDAVGAVVYPSKKFVEEAALAHGLARLACAPVTPIAGADSAIGVFEQSTGATLAPEQRHAVHAAACQGVLVITGGPGTGKTTIVRAVLRVFENARLRVALAAPTGRAARRMEEATHREARTLHRLLEFDPRTNTFTRDERNPLDADAIVIDESSMLDQSLGFALVRAVRSGARLVLVGDVDQLPSIGAGAVLRDVIESDQIACVRLNQVFRQASESRIVRNAHRIRAGLAPETTPPGGPLGDFYVVAVRDAAAAADLVLRMVSDRIPTQFGLDPRRDVQVLTPMRKGAAGSDALNSALQHALNPSGSQLAVGARALRVGDKVMQLRNDYGRDVFNGDVGLVHAVDPDAGRMVVDIDGRSVHYDGVQVDDLTLAYACSIHKSQGSEYPAVVIPMVSAHFVMLSRNLLYTAVTRGKQLVVLVTDEKALRWALADARREDRFTYLFERLRLAVARLQGGEGHGLPTGHRGGTTGC